MIKPRGIFAIAAAYGDPIDVWTLDDSRILARHLLEAHNEHGKVHPKISVLHRDDPEQHCAVCWDICVQATRIPDPSVMEVFEGLLYSIERDIDKMKREG